MTRMPIFRTAEQEHLDLSTKHDAEWCRTNYPAIMATRPVGMSEDYQFMPSFDIANSLQDTFGLKLVEVGQQFSRSRDPAGQEHFMKFRFPNNMMTLKQVGDSAPELVIMNSHNGRSTIRAYAGIFRFVCANGMVVSTESFGQIKLRHFGQNNTYDAFSGVLSDMARRMAVLDARLAMMNSVLLDRKQQLRLARMVMKERGVPTWVEPDHVLEVHRPEDSLRADGLRSMWVTFNVIQENLTSKTVVHAPVNARPVQMRPITGARAHLLTNERIWAGLEAFVHKEMAHLAADLFDGSSAGETVDVVPSPAPRSPSEILALATYDELCGATEAELEAFSKDERKKLSSRKSYLKKKEMADA